MITRREFSLAVLAAGLGMRNALAAFPDQPLKLQVSFTAGGQSDGIFRQLAAAWSRELGQTVLIENRPGAGGNIAAKYVAAASPNGLVILAGGIGTIGGLNRYLYKSPGFDAQSDFQLIGVATTEPGILCMSRTVPITNLKEFLAYAKAHPKAINFASAGSGSSSHLTMEYLKTKAGIDMVHVPYRQSTQGTTDLMAGVVQARLLGVTEALAYKEDARIRLIGVTATNRLSLIPDVPAISEQVPGYEATFPSGFAVPAKTPADVVTRLRTSLTAALKRPELQAGLEKSGVSVYAQKDAPDAYLAKEVRKWQTVITSAGVVNE